jgi:hypothetical protein
MQPRFYIETMGGSWIVHDRSRVIEGQAYRNPRSAEYVCDALNQYHELKTKRYTSAD